MRNTGASREEIRQGLREWVQQEPGDGRESLGGVNIAAGCPAPLMPLAVWTLARLRRQLNGRGYFVIRRRGDHAIYLHDTETRGRTGREATASDMLREAIRITTYKVAEDAGSGRGPHGIGWDVWDVGTW